jgi:hypothetical protein
LDHGVVEAEQGKEGNVMVPWANYYIPVEEKALSHDQAEDELDEPNQIVRNSAV